LVVDATPHPLFSRFSPERIRLEPYPHAWTSEALEPAYYVELEAAFPSLERIAGPGALANNRPFRLPACEVLDDPSIPSIWRRFFAYHCSGAFLRDQLSLSRAAIEREYPDVEARFGKPLSEITGDVRRCRPGSLPENLPENLRADAMLDCQFVVNSPVTKPSSVRGSHVDRPFKLFVALLYFRHPEDRSSGGNLRIERLRAPGPHFDRRQHVDERIVESFAEIPYAPNTLVAWLNTARSVHSVTPRSQTRVPRRYVNFLTECYALRSETFLEPEWTLPARIHASAKRVIRRRALRAVAAR
jgi:hypothetical protein